MRAILNKNANLFLTKKLPKTIENQRKIIFSTTNFKKFSEINYAMKNLKMPTVTIVRDKEHAKHVVNILKKHKDRFHAWDTETNEIDVKEQSPVLFGKIICMSCFIGPDIDFGNGPRLFVDNYADADNLVQVFKDYFEDNSYLKVWHNYGFDRHIFYHHGINVKGLGADTLHMARMYDTSKLPGEFSLKKLSEIYSKEIIKIRSYYLDYYKKKYESSSDEGGDENSNESLLQKLIEYEKFNEGDLKKIDMKTLFQSKKILATGGEGKTYTMPEIEELHTNANYVENWVKYSVLDAEVTYYLRDVFQLLLKSLSTRCLTHKNPVGDKFKDNYDLYLEYWRVFGELLTDMERIGIKVDVDYLKKKQEEAEKDLLELEQDFIKWVHSIQPSLIEFNPGSVQQLQQLLFAPCYRKISPDKFKKPNFRTTTKAKATINPDELQEENIDDESDLNGSNGLISAKELNNVNSNEKLVEVLPEERIFRVENVYKIKQEDGKVLKYRDMIIKGLGLKPLGFTVGGLPAIDQHIVKDMLKKEANGFSYGYNQFFEKFGDEIKAKNFEVALSKYEKYKTIETLLKTFIIPLQEAADRNGRIHCSLNLNTDTGRISARRPNLQNQPANDKDIYKVRYAFKAEKGNKFIVADYGQLELRILANITECKSMIEAFRLGGDFHSRTALGMFTEIQEAIDKGECLLEWDSSKGKPPVPLLKDMFSGLRKKAKTMNFSIAYGKSAIGFSKDWNCSIKEAEDSLKKWYSNRKEVEEWQNKVKRLAVDKGYTQTLIGRYRNLRNKMSEPKLFGHGLRAAINTPIQGGAADVVIAAMIKLFLNERLREIRYKIILQIHDEVILEGPEEHAEEALKITIECMESPFDYEFPIKLEVDAKIGDNWYEAK